MTFESDKSGIYSLAGFAYQIKVFIYYAFDLEKNMQIEFESLEDITLKVDDADAIDRNSHYYRCEIKNGESNIAIQVKHTTLNSDRSQQMLLNWMMLEYSSHNIDEYILFTDEKYNNKDLIFSKSVDELYKYVDEVDTKSRSTRAKVKNLCAGDEDGFKKIYSQIEEKYNFISLEDIDKKIKEKQSIAKYFLKDANEVVFHQRLKELLSTINNNVMISIQKTNPYILTYKEFVSIIEEINSRFTPTITNPSYSRFKNKKDINLEDSQFSQSREFKQLKACNLPENIVKRHLLYGLYYTETSLKYLENNRESIINDIEETTFENFEDVKYRLGMEKRDKPYTRLEETKSSENTYASNNQIKYGALISLTKENSGENQISWEDEDNA